ncbi:sulfatase family protein [Pontiella sulfatireligans]|uniref:Arylsulfatase n=1 Tax=Pontiella sulfatireligans TaxID=2750658 RepID=A0A6C2UEX7_9BACT|nr:arylsulfatase [Pontiella sulfatireligans]SPS74228.1 sulfatase S1_15 [Kiritimatiellales bacterium]VGO18705.1 Arylsulfatase [Pontiella sulfatireligans]
MKRKRVVCGFGLGLLLLGTGYVSAQSPNIVIIYADDLGYGEVKALNPERCKLETPAIDSLARDGMVFTDGHSSSAVCTPSRYSMLTGRYSWRSKLQKGVLNPWGENLLNPERITMPELVRTKGYLTAAIGKWHLGWDWQKRDGSYVFDEPVRGGPVDHGYDYYFGPDVPDFPPFAWIENDRLTAMPTENSKPDPRGGRGGPLVPGWDPEAMLSTMAGKAADYFDERASDKNPFFLYFGLTSPHTPIVPSKAWQGKSGMGAYCDFVLETDHTVGQVLQALEKSGLDQNTLVFFSSDNGCSSGPSKSIKLAKELGHYTSGKLRGHKGSNFEGGTRVPFIVRWPGVVPAGSVCDQMVCQIDYMATVADVLGIEMPASAGVDSISFLPLLKEPQAAPPRETLILHNYYGEFALRDGPYKLILAPGNGQGFGGGPSDAEAIQRGDPMVQLYNLGDDVAETTNLANIHPERVQLMTEKLVSSVARGRTTPGKPLRNDAEIDLYKKHLHKGK